MCTDRSSDGPSRPDLGICLSAGRSFEARWYLIVGVLTLAGSDDGTVCVFEMRSRQAVRTINTPSKAPVATVLTLDRPTFMPSGGPGPSVHRRYEQ
eukprot:scaffold145422_cov18-Prasinocladus_malaysianus.AAC.1